MSSVVNKSVLFAVLTCSVSVFPSITTAQTQVVTFPAANSTTNVAPLPEPSGGMPAAYGAGGYQNGQQQVYGNVQLCGQPPYVYPCGYNQMQQPMQSPFGQTQQAAPPNVNDGSQTYGLSNQGSGNVTFQATPQNYVDLSPSTDGAGIGNTVGPILAERPAIKGTYAGGSYTRSDIMNPSSSFYTGGGGGDNVREKQLRDLAYRTGVEAGLIAEAQRIDNALLKYRYTLDQTFAFDTLLLSNGAVVPPVITTITDVSERRSSEQLYLTTGAYEIVQPAFVTDKPPAWQDYLENPTGEVTRPASIRVKSKSDRALWAEAARSGWSRGVKEARAQFSANLARLVRDYRGMETFHRLADLGAVSVPSVKISRKDGAIYMNGRKAVGESATVNITVQPRFKSTKKAALALQQDSERNAMARAER